jgi:hypothetical protein
MSINLDDTLDSVLNVGNLSFLSFSSASSTSSASSNSSEEGDADDEEDDNVELEKRKYHFWIRTMTDKASRMNDRQFLANFRMLPETFEALLEEFGGYMPLGRSSNGKNLSPRERLLAFLWYAGSNSSFSQGEYAHEMAFGSVWNRQVVVFLQQIQRRQ